MASTAAGGRALEQPQNRSSAHALTGLMWSNGFTFARAPAILSAYGTCQHTASQDLRKTVTESVMQQFWHE